MRNHPMAYDKEASNVHGLDQIRHNIERMPEDQFTFAMPNYDNRWSPALPMPIISDLHLHVANMSSMEQNTYLHRRSLPYSCHYSHADLGMYERPVPWLAKSQQNYESSDVDSLDNQSSEAAPGWDQTGEAPGYL